MCGKISVDDKVMCMFELSYKLKMFLGAVSSVLMPYENFASQ